MVAILGYSREQILTAVKDMYTAVAEAPASPSHFPVARDAAQLLGYASDDPDRLPPGLLEFVRRSRLSVPGGGGCGR